MPKRRDPWLDNAKTVLIVVVVVGHAVILLPAGDLRSQLYDFIYYFHIPAFVVLTGYLSRSFAWNRRHLTALVYTLVVPYVLFEWLMANFRVLIGEVSSIEVLQPLWLNPHWPMWYLIVLVIWRLATPVLKLHWAMVPASVVVSLLAGSVNLELFDLNRALGLLPFFVIGLHLPRAALAAAQARGTGLLGLAVLAWIWWLAGHTDDHWGTQWLYYRAPYDELGATFGDGVWIRLRLLGIGLAGTLALLSLVPRRRGRFTKAGYYTMGVYLLHGFVLRWAMVQGYDDWMPGDGWASVAITVTLAVALALGLAWPPLAGRLLWVVDPITTALEFRRRRRAAPRLPAPR